MARLRPPTTLSLLQADTRPTAPAWLMYFQGLADGLAVLQGADLALAQSVSHVNDAAAAAAGVAIGGRYRNGSVVMVRVV